MFGFERRTLEEFLGSLGYPLSRQQLLDSAHEADLPVQLQAMLQRLEERDYRSAEDVEGALAAHKA